MGFSNAFNGTFSFFSRRVLIIFFIVLFNHFITIIIYDVRMGVYAVILFTFFPVETSMAA